MRAPLALAAALTLGLVSCATLPTSHPAPRPLPVSVRLEHVPEGNLWRVHYRFAEPVRTARFPRKGHGYRQSHWKVLAPAGMRIEAVDGGDQVSSASGEPFTALEVEISQYAWKPEKDYQAFIPFLGGGVLVFTGQLDLMTSASDTVHYTLVPQAPERVALLGQVSDSPVEWVSAHEGTYVYFGTSRPIESEHLISFVDPALPAWIGQQVAEQLPRLFAFYAERTGAPLGQRAVVFLSYGEEARAGSISLNGGTLEGLVQLEVRLGSDYQQRVPAVEERVLMVLAHEAAHLWHGQKLFHEVPAGDWMHEGGADAFAYRALLHLGLLSPEAYSARLSEAASRCVSGLGGRPLKDVAGPGRFRNHYTCGSTLALIAEAEARKADPRVDVFTFWARLAALAGEKRRYDEPLYFQALSTSGVAPECVDWMRRFVEETPAEPAPELLEALKRAGLELRLTGAGGSGG
jgi:hypothetical protein